MKQPFGDWPPNGCSDSEGFVSDEEFETSAERASVVVTQPDKELKESCVTDKHLFF